MSTDLQRQIRDNLSLKETDELLEIWQKGDAAEWSAEAFELIREILKERLGYLPPQSTAVQVLEILDSVERHLDNYELGRALRECERALELDPNSAPAYNYRGEIHEEMGQLGKAIADYQQAVRLDPDLEEALLNLSSLEADIEEEFLESAVKQRLDRALDHAHDGETERALEECETAGRSLPNISAAYNYLGLILHTLDRFEPAIEAYQKAIQLNPRFHPARQNLCAARLALEEEQYHKATLQYPDDTDQPGEEYDESQIPDSGESIPQWLYMDESAFVLSGWPGHRTRQGRSGYDPLDSEFEFAHMVGVLVHKLATGTYRTQGPVKTILMVCAGALFCSPLLALTSITRFDWVTILLILHALLIASPYWTLGFALWVNVITGWRYD